MNCRRKQIAKTIRKGAMLPMVAFVMIIIIVGAVFSVDIAHMHMVRAELRTATDAAARAGAEALARTQDPDLAIDAALRIANRNLVSGEGLILERDDVVLGTAESNASGGLDFVAGQQPFTSVRVRGHRDEESAQGPVTLLFGSLLGVSEFQPVQIASASSSVRDIALVLDRSGSMQRADAGDGLTRNQALINAVLAFVDEIEATSPNSAISLTTYSTEATQDIGVTENYDQIRNAIADLPAQGRTNIRQGLLFGSDSLQANAAARPFAERTIVVMTDGNFNVGGTPIPSANIAANRNHTIHTITFSSGANEDIMEDVADVGGGIHIHADNAGDLTDAFREIARTINVALIE